MWTQHVNTKFSTFSLRFSAQPLLSQNSNLNCCQCYFLCFIWTFWGLSELLLTCQQILTASCEHARTLPLFSRAGIAWTQSYSFIVFVNLYTQNYKTASVSRRISLDPDIRSSFSLRAQRNFWRHFHIEYRDWAEMRGKCVSLDIFSGWNDVIHVSIAAQRHVSNVLFVSYIYRT